MRRRAPRMRAGRAVGQASLHDALGPCVPGASVLAASLAIVLMSLPGPESYAQGPAQAPPPDDITAADLLASMPSDVRIVARENHEIEEFRVGNNVYMIKVKPRGAPPYYLIDEDGSGDLQWRRGLDVERTSVPHWAIIRW